MENRIMDSPDLIAQHVHHRDRGGGTGAAGGGAAVGRHPLLMKSVACPAAAAAAAAAQSRMAAAAAAATAATASSSSSCSTVTSAAGPMESDARQAACRFTVGADESFPLPPFPVFPVCKPPSYCSSDSSGDSGISLHHLPSSSSSSFTQLNGSPAAAAVTSSRYGRDDHAAVSEWLSTESPAAVTSPAGQQQQQHPPLSVIQPQSTAAGLVATVNRRLSAATSCRMNGAAGGGDHSPSTSSRSSTASSGSGSSGGGGGGGGFTGSLSYLGNHNNNISNGGSGSFGRSNHHPHLQQQQQQQVHHHQQQQQDGSGSSSRLSYHSTASSGDSRTSLDRLECDSGFTSTCGIDVSELIHQGYSDADVLFTWLASMHLDQLYQLFIQAGYDMPTISRMTPENLTAIGITQPAIRKRLTAEISQLNIDDGIPQFKPSSVSEWLNMLCLNEYLNVLAQDGYNSMDNVTEITWEDLEEMGIHKLGHQKKLMLAIDRLKKLDGGGVVRSPPVNAIGAYIPATPPVHVLLPSETHSPIRRKPSLSSTFSRLHRSSSTDSSNHSVAAAAESASEIIHIQNSTAVATPELVAIQVNRSWSSGNDGCSSNNLPSSLTYESFRGPPVKYSETNFAGRSADELYGGEKTPTNDSGDTLSADDEMEPPKPAPMSPPMSPNRPRPQIAPKPRLELRQRRASAGEAPQENDIEEMAAGKTTLRRTSSRCGAESVDILPSTAAGKPGLGILAAVSSHTGTLRRPPVNPVDRSSASPMRTSSNGTSCSPDRYERQTSAPAVHTKFNTSTPSTNGLPHSSSCATKLPDRFERQNSSPAIRAEVNDGNPDRHRPCVHAVTSVDSSTKTGTSLSHRQQMTEKRVLEPADCAVLPNDSKISFVPLTGESKSRGDIDSPKKPPPAVLPKRTNSFKAYSVGPKSGNDAQKIDSSSVAIRNTSVSQSSTSLRNGQVSSARPEVVTRGNPVSSPRSTSVERGSLHREPSVSPCPSDGSNTLPFANENVGTIRQRAVPSADPLDTTSEVLQHETVLEERSPISNAANCKKPVRPVPLKKPKIITQTSKPNTSSIPASNDSSPLVLNAAMTSSALDTEDVFNDIDSMFQGLTQELDQMLMLN